MFNVHVSLIVNIVFVPKLHVICWRWIWMRIFERWKRRICSPFPRNPSLWYQYNIPLQIKVNDGILWLIVRWGWCNFNILMFTTLFFIHIYINNGVKKFIRLFPWNETFLRYFLASLLSLIVFILKSKFLFISIYCLLANNNDKTTTKWIRNFNKTFEWKILSPVCGHQT